MTRNGASVRSRAVLAAFVALVPALLLASVAAVLLQRHDLTSSTVLVAREHAAAVERQWEDGATPSSAVAAAGGEDLVQIVELASGKGRVVAATGGMSRSGPLAPQGSRSRTTAGLLPGEGDRYVVVTRPAPSGYVVVARSLEGVDQAASSTTGILGVGSLLVMAAVCGLTWLLIGRALRPVESMRRRASEMTTADLSARLPVPTTGDEIERLATTMNDLLERTEEAVVAQRRFVADASHELRSPIASVRALHETAHLGAPGQGAIDLTSEVLTEVRRLDDLVADLLFLARDNAGGEERQGQAIPVDLAVEAAFLVDRPRRVPVTLMTSGSTWVLGDPRALSRMIRNLLDNAERHAASSIVVMVESVAADVRLVVSDDGPGIPDHERERVFGRFVRLDEARSRDAGGSGLGLAIVRQIATRHGGTAQVSDPSVRDNPMTGALITVTLPGLPPAHGEPHP
ncbi:MAG: ATP-binding protein [Nocardioides sp.]|uniref:ATP-binding protein n=1 Tax=Nocardioides sp. TaxID=35761 RepID=UPI0039E53E1B